MGDPVLTSTQKKILELCAQHQDGLTFKEFIKENYRKNLGIPLNELGRLLSELVFLRLLREDETDPEKWLITLVGLSAIGAAEKSPWP
jgi:hypothetical protein